MMAARALRPPYAAATRPLLTSLTHAILVYALLFY